MAAIFKLVALAAVVVSTALALPATNGTGLALSSSPDFTVECGCWNLCTLERTTNPGVGPCDDSCGQ